MTNNLPDSLLKSSMILAAADSLGILPDNIPNVFTPNGDKINDHFLVETPDGKVYDFKIFTPTGTLIYSSKSPSVLWDGRNSGGMEVPEGIYYYVIELADESSSEGICGFLYLFR